MPWEAFLFSARVAWQRPRFRWMTIGIVTFVVAFGLYFLWRIFPLRSHPDVVVHYTIYLGIDEVRHWSWLLAPLLVWWGLVALDVFGAFLYYRTDPFAAWTLLVLAGAASIPWAIALYSLMQVNV